MLQIMFQKMWHKKWMNASLLFGCSLFIAMIICFPLYERAAYNRMLQEVFEEYIFEEGKWPTAVKFLAVKSEKKIQSIEELADSIYDRLGVTKRETIRHYYISKSEAKTHMDRDDVSKMSVRLGYQTGFNEHATILAGTTYSESGLTDDGKIEVVISEACMASQKLVVGETIDLLKLTDAKGKKLQLYVTGVFSEGENEDFYWQESLGQTSGICMMNQELFESMFMRENSSKYTVVADTFDLFEYQDIDASQVRKILSATSKLTSNKNYKYTISTADYTSILKDYLKKETKIKATLTILQVPMLIMLAAFLLMISSQMYEMEKNEISVIKSRGSSRTQIFMLYLYQSIFLTILGGCIGVPLGFFFSKILGTAETFLEFDFSQRLDVSFDREAAIYTVVSMVVVLLILTFPAIKHSKTTIVNLKQQNAAVKKKLWEKLYLDVILCAVSLYGFYSFSGRTAEIEKSVLMGNALDPLLYISSSLFIFGTGLLFLRLQPLFIKLIYLIGRKYWKPASYASFMENLKNGRKQQFIMIFLILTISMGMYHATVARTILQNAVENTRYLDGADVIIKEVWSDNSAAVSASAQSGAEETEFMYFEPDYGKYAALQSVKSYTKVIYDSDAYMTEGRKKQMVTLMGIHTKEFGENTFVEEKYLGEHYYSLLNKLAAVQGGVLLSSNFRDVQGYQVGDTISFNNSRKKNASGEIVGFFDYFPGYTKNKIELNPDGTTSTEENYMIVAHYDALYQKWGVTPYQVWLTLRDGEDTQEMTEWIKESKMKLEKFVDRKKDLRSVMQDPLLQGTNGILTMEFIVTILLCAVGYLIYWVMSVKSRALMFGVLRACGMHRLELIHMLMNEQLFSGAFSILAGIGIGKLTSYLFVPMIQIAFSSANQVLPIEMIMDRMDMLRLYGVIVLVVVVCLFVLVSLLFKLNIANTLKLGEE